MPFDPLDPVRRLSEPSRGAIDARRMRRLAEQAAGASPLARLGGGRFYGSLIGEATAPALPPQLPPAIPALALPAAISTAVAVVTTAITPGAPVLTSQNLSGLGSGQAVLYADSGGGVLTQGALVVVQNIFPGGYPVNAVVELIQDAAGSWYVSGPPPFVGAAAPADGGQDYAANTQSLILWHDGFYDSSGFIVLPQPDAPRNIAFQIPPGLAGLYRITANVTLFNPSGGPGAGSFLTGYLQSSGISPSLMPNSVSPIVGYTASAGAFGCIAFTVEQQMAVGQTVQLWAYPNGGPTMTASGIISIVKIG